MPFPEVVLIEGYEEGCMLYRYRGDRTFCGDTWHQSLEDAQEQCSYEYGEALGPWVPVPASVPDAHGFAIASAGVRPET